ncbi:MAG: amino acid permease [Hyphomicrobiales bacterium]|nr:MAG: amino acid permease [Hyphomicrobiales bacterium]
MTELKRSISLTMLVLYGLGVTIGAGIYVLIGEVAALAGYGAPLSFVAAAAAAGLTALSFSELATRYPESAGEAAYTEAGYRSPLMGTLIGLAVAAAGVISAAAVAIGAARYLATLVPIPPALAVIVIVVLLGAVAVRGIAESVAFAGLMTIVEAGGLILIAAGAVIADPDILAKLGDTMSAAFSTAPMPIAAGAVIAFFAFIGFEDMVNVIEEVHEPQKTVPRAILLTLFFATLIYLSVAAIAVTVIPPDVLAKAPAPLAAVAEASGLVPAVVISSIAVAAGVNGILVQIVMASRVLYGIARRGWIPAWLSSVNPRTRTPLRATVLVTVIATALAVALPIEKLAAGTSVLALTIFLIVNGALILIKRREGTERATFHVPIAVPVAGAVITAALIVVALL